MSRGVKISLAEKVDLVDWIITGRGSQAEWARKNKHAAETVSRLLDDPDVQQLLDAAERGQEKRFSLVVEKAYQIVMDPDHMHWPQAANFLAKVHGKYKPEKIDHTIIDRVAYVQPFSLRELSADIDARPN